MNNTLLIRFLGDAAFLILTIAISCLANFVLHFEVRGINCGDLSIQKKYKPPSLPNVVLNLAFYAFPFVFLAASELILFPWKGSKDLKLKTAMKIYSMFTVFIFGVFAQSALVTFLQTYTGEARPHFIDVCKPNWNCTYTDFMYVERIDCTGNADLVKNARLSFPSADAAKSSLTMSFLCIYVQTKFNCEKTPYGKWLLQTVFAMSSIVAGIKNVSDNMNHWRDVYSGLVLGTSSAIFFAYSVNWFKDEKQ